VGKHQSGDRAQRQAGDHAHLLKRVWQAQEPESNRTANEICERRIVPVEK